MTIDPAAIAGCDADLFRRGMRQLAGAVAVITVAGPDGRNGLTATAVMSLAAEPPTLLISINRNASSWPLLCAAASFGVNILAGDQDAIANRFAGRDAAQGAARYALGDWTTLATGAPILADALVAFDCRLEQQIDLFTHSLFIGRVAALREREDSAPLLYWRGDYRRLHPAQG